MQLDSRGRRHPFDTIKLSNAVAQRADISAAVTQMLQALGQHPGNRGFTVGTCNANRIQCLRRRAIKAIRNLAELTREIVDGDHRNASISWRLSIVRIPRDRTCAGIDSVLQVVKAVATDSLTGEKQEPVP